MRILFVPTYYTAYILHISSTCEEDTAPRSYNEIMENESCLLWARRWRGGMALRMKNSTINCAMTILQHTFVDYVNGHRVCK